MRTETIDTLVRARKQILRCEQHLAEIHERLQVTSCAIAKSQAIFDAYAAAAAPAGLPSTATPDHDQRAIAPIDRVAVG